MYQYSFANVDLTLFIPPFAEGSPETVSIEGYGAGEGLINIARRAPIATTQFGAYGDMVVSMQRIVAVDLSFTLLMNAPENAKLQDFANGFQDKAWRDGALVAPINAHMVDMMGNDAAMMHNGVILAMPAMVRGQTMNLVTWVSGFESGMVARERGGDHTAIGGGLGGPGGGF